MPSTTTDKYWRTGKNISISFPQVHQYISEGGSAASAMCDVWTSGKLGRHTCASGPNKHTRALFSLPHTHTHTARATHMCTCVRWWWRRAAKLDTTPNGTHPWHWTRIFLDMFYVRLRLAGGLHVRRQRRQQRQRRHRRQRRRRRLVWIYWRVCRAPADVQIFPKRCAHCRRTVFSQLLLLLFCVIRHTKCFYRRCAGARGDNHIPKQAAGTCSRAIRPKKYKQYFVAWLNAPHERHIDDGRTRVWECLECIHVILKQRYLFDREQKLVNTTQAKNNLGYCQHM